MSPRRRSSLLPPPRELLQLLTERPGFVLTTHRGPDGDALGSSLALCLALRAQGKEAQVVVPTAVGDHYLWLPGSETLTRELSAPPAVAIVMDCDSPGRLDHLEGLITAAPVLVQIDHHTGTSDAQVQYVDPQASATCCLIWRVLRALAWPLTPEIATCLYVGIATDTGFFRFENTNPEAFSICSELVACGAEPSRIAELLHDRRPLRRLQLAGRALASLQSASDGRLIWGVLGPEDYAATGCRAADTETIVDLLKQAEDQEVCVLFKSPRAGDPWQVSLRSRTVDVAAAARRYGGGGHARAAGFDFAGPLEQLRASLLPLLIEQLDGNEA
jgi:bifunctional oligoribonuclease and PAP phosphatase NrnA